MPSVYTFQAAIEAHDIADLREACIRGLSNAPDGMWQHFRNSATHYGIYAKGSEPIGYACVNEQGQLLQFYLTPAHYNQGPEVLETFIHVHDVKQGIVGTNNLIYFSMASHLAQQLSIHTYLFRDYTTAAVAEKPEELRKCTTEDLSAIVDFCHYSIGAPKAWLKNYVGGLIDKGEVFVLAAGETIIGTCEVRENVAMPTYVDIGMIVSPDYRKQGYGTYLLSLAKSIAIKQGKTPICSCEKGNIGSLKSIQNCGFISKYQLLLIDFAK